MYVKLEVLGGENILDVFNDMCAFTRNTGMNCCADVNGTPVFCTLSDTPDSLGQKFNHIQNVNKSRER